MSLHADARSVLAGWTAPDPGQEALRAAYLAHLDEYGDAMRRECLPGHLTASAAIVSSDGSHVVLTLHKTLRMWLQTGGHCEPEDTALAAAALREATEESGISGVRVLPDPVRLDRHAVPCGGGTHHLDVQFAAVAPADAVLVRDPAESSDLGWFPARDLPEPTDDSVRALVRAAVSAVDAAVAAHTEGSGGGGPVSAVGIGRAGDGGGAFGPGGADPATGTGGADPATGTGGADGAGGLRRPSSSP